MPDLRGLFLRGYGSQAHSQNNGASVGITSTTHASGALQTVQGDAFRDISTSGALNFHMGRGLQDYITLIDGSGIFSVTWEHSNGRSNHVFDGSYPYGVWPKVTINFSGGLPTSNEIRPVNMAVRYLIRAFP